MLRRVRGGGSVVLEKAAVPHAEVSEVWPRGGRIVIRGEMYETHADVLAKIPSALRELFGRLDALYRQSVGSQRR